MELASDFREFLSLLLSKNVRFLLIGAHALAAHGRPRYTGDLDVWVSPTQANAKQVIAALRAFGFGTVGLSAKDFGAMDRVVQLGYPPLRIDILTSISGVFFPAAWKHRLVASIAGLKVPVLSRDDYLTNKRAAGRPKDLLDVALLEEGEPRARRRKLRPKS